MKKMILFWIVCLFVSSFAYSQKKDFGNGLFWELSNDGTLTISGNGDMPNFKEFETPWWGKRSRIRKLVIEEGIASIGRNSFSGYLGNEKKRFWFIEVQLPSSLKTIGDNAFKWSCIGKMVFPQGLHTIGCRAFEWCRNLEEVVLPNSVLSIGDDCFDGNKDMRVLKLSEGMTIIPRRAFAGCINLTEIVFPKNLIKIEEEAFNNYRFYYQNFRKKISVTEVGKLKRIILPMGIEEIGDLAFYGNDLEEISLPLSLKIIGKNAIKHYYKEFNGKIVALPPFVNEQNSNMYGLSSQSVKRYYEGVHDTEGKLILEEEYGRSITKGKYSSNGIEYYVVSEHGKTGLMNSKGIWIIPLTKNYSEISQLSIDYIKVKSSSYYGILDIKGNEIIPTSRGYTSIGDFNTTSKTFSFTKKGYSGVCNEQGQEISLTRLAPTSNEIKSNGGYASVEEVKNGSTKYYIVSKGGKYGLTDAEGKVIVPAELEALATAGDGFLKYKLNGFWGVMNYSGKIIIDTDRGYTSIGDFVTFTKRFPYTMLGYKGECDVTGKQISKIKVDTPQQTTTASSSSTSSSSSSSTGTGTSTIVVEHHRDPVPVQQWQACFACGGMGTMGCDGCGGSGTRYYGNSLRICGRCNGQGLIPCNVCFGNKGKYITVYQ